MATNPFAVEDYLAVARSRVTELFKDKPIFDRYLQILIDENIEIQNVFKDLMQKRSIDTATGEQLDIIGRIVGQPRELIDTALIEYFAFQGYPDAMPYGDLNDTSLGGLYYDLSAPLTGNTLLNDEQYRLFIKAKIIKNTSYITPNQFLDFVNFVFGVDINNVVAEGNAEFTIMLGKNLSSFERVLLNYISYAEGYPSRFVPKPIGVRINFGQFNASNFFGFQGTPGAKGYGSYGLKTLEESLIMNFVDQSYQIDTEIGVIGGGKYGGLL